MRLKLSEAIEMARNFQRDRPAPPIAFFSEIFRWILLKNGEKKIAGNMKIRISCIPERESVVYICIHATTGGGA